MVEGAECLRIEPEVIVGDVWSESRPSRYLAQGLLGLTIAAVETVAFGPLAGGWSIPIGMATGLVAGACANGSSLLLLRARLSGRKSASREAKHEASDQCSAGDITAGLWICPSEVLAGQRRRYEDQVASEERAFEAAILEWRRETLAIERLRAAGVEPAEPPPPQPRRPPLPPPPTGTFKQVVAVKRTGSTVQFAWRGRAVGVTEAVDGEQYNCLKRTVRADARHYPAAVALSALMRMLPENLDEAELIAAVERAGNDRAAARQALRGALAWGLVEQTGGTLADKTHQYVALFHRPSSPQPARSITITPAGEVWAFADGRSRA